MTRWRPLITGVVLSNEVIALAARLPRVGASIVGEDTDAV